MTTIKMMRRLIVMFFIVVLKAKKVQGIVGRSSTLVLMLEVI